MINKATEQRRIRGAARLVLLQLANIWREDKVLKDKGRLEKDYIDAGVVAARMPRRERAPRETLLGEGGKDDLICPI